jgi:hypothetical protein
LFVNFKSAYDSIYQEKLLCTMMELGIPSKLIRLVKTTNDECAMLSPDSVSSVRPNIYHTWSEIR